MNSGRPFSISWHALSEKKTACCISSGHSKETDRAPATRVCCSGARLIGLSLYGVASRSSRFVSEGVLPAWIIGKHLVLCEVAGQLRPCSDFGKDILASFASR